MEEWKILEKKYEAKTASIYERGYYTTYLENYYLGHFIRFLKKYIKKTDYILDLGCATGILEQHLIKDGYKNIVGVDISKEMISIARKKIDNVNFYVADGEELPFKDASFDVVICSSVLHHFPDLSSVLPEIKRVMKEYGVVIAREPNENHHFVNSSWLSGAVMNLMHYFYRIERYQPVTEPPIHKYHHAFKSDELFTQFAEHFYILYFSTHFPLTCFYTKLRNQYLSRCIIFLEKFLRDLEGNQFYMVAANYEASFSGVRRLLSEHIRYLRDGKKEPKIFLLGMYFLLWLAKLYEKKDR